LQCYLHSSLSSSRNEFTFCKTLFCRPGQIHILSQLKASLIVTAVTVTGVIAPVPSAINSLGTVVDCRMSLDDYITAIFKACNDHAWYCAIYHLQLHWHWHVAWLTVTQCYNMAPKIMYCQTGWSAEYTSLDHAQLNNRWTLIQTITNTSLNTSRLKNCLPSCIDNVCKNALHIFTNLLSDHAINSAVSFIALL